MGLFTKDKKITGHVIIVNVRENRLKPESAEKVF